MNHWILSRDFACSRVLPSQTRVGGVKSSAAVAMLRHLPPWHLPPPDTSPPKIVIVKSAMHTQKPTHNLTLRAVVSAFWAFLSSRHSSALHCFRCIVSVLINKIFIHSFITVTASCCLAKMTQVKEADFESNFAVCCITLVYRVKCYWRCNICSFHCLSLFS